jgi:hypothetical protein
MTIRQLTAGITGAALLALLLVAVPGVGVAQPVPAPKAEAANDNKVEDAARLIDVDMIDWDIHRALLFISMRSGLQVNVAGNVSGRVTVLYRNVTGREAIAHICRALGLQMIEDGSVIIVQADSAKELKPISVDFVREDISKVMAHIAEHTGLTIEVADDLEVVVTALFRNTDPLEIVRAICTAHNLELTEDGRTLKIAAAKDDQED